MKGLDYDGSGEVSLDEFAKWWFRGCKSQNSTTILKLKAAGLMNTFSSQLAGKKIYNIVSRDTSLNYVDEEIKIN